MDMVLVQTQEDGKYMYVVKDDKSILLCLIIKFCKPGFYIAGMSLLLSICLCRTVYLHCMSSVAVLCLGWRCICV